MTSFSYSALLQDMLLADEEGVNVTIQKQDYKSFRGSLASTKSREKIQLTLKITVLEIVGNHMKLNCLLTEAPAKTRKSSIEILVHPSTGE